ncbi:hypothetical protein E2C01_057899 [Portunus trituberculatus]|uniref:Uncharacterized protein n=1 Tax=Portunus trituberculatus TaxID=210409 RepID=A0A5B7H1R7_PORTR|nr:hypothetical protein [Portunus trituberculatus]
MITPGSFLPELNASLRDNNIAKIELSNKNPNSAKLFQGTIVNSPHTPHHFPKQSTYSKKQDDNKKQKEVRTILRI